MRTYFVRSCFLASAVSLVPVTSEAATITQNLDVTPLQLSTNAGGSVQILPLNFNRFDPAQGTLNSVEWSWNGKIEYVFRAVGGPQVYDGESGEFVDSSGFFLWFNRQVFLRDTADAQIANPLLNNGIVQAFAALAPSATTPGYPGYTLRSTDTLGPADQTWSAPAELVPFIGLGTNNLSLSAQVAQTGVDSTLAVLDGYSEFSFTSTLTFDYTPIPEPTLIALAPLAAAFLRRRHRAAV